MASRSTLDGGLTSDRLPPARRQRRLTLDALVAGALIEYPLYLSRDGLRLITAEEAVTSLEAWRSIRGMHVRWWQRIVRVFLRLLIGVR